MCLTAVKMRVQAVVAVVAAIVAVVAMTNEYIETSLVIQSDRM